MRDRSPTIGRPTSKRQSVAAVIDNDFTYPGNYFVDETHVTAMKPVYNTPNSKITQFTTTIRILPGKDPYDPSKWDYTRDPVNPAPSEFGTWIQCYHAWRSGGYPSITFLCSFDTLHFDPRNNPGGILHGAIKNAVDKGLPVCRPHWGAMIATNTGASPIIQKVKKMFVAQCLVFEKGGTLYNPPTGLGLGHKIVVMDLGWDAGKGVIERVNERNLDYRGDDPEQMFVYGDPIALESGKFFQIYPKARPPQSLGGPAVNPNQPRAGNQPRQLSAGAFQDPSRRRRMDDRGGSKDAREAGYSVAVLDTFDDWSPSLIEFEPELAARVKPWEEILTVYDEEEQACMIANVLVHQGYARLDTIEYAWADHPEWLAAVRQQPIWAKYVGRTQVQPAGSEDAATGPVDTAVEAPASDPAPPVRRLTPGSVSRRPPDADDAPVPVAAQAPPDEDGRFRRDRVAPPQAEPAAATREDLEPAPPPRVQRPSGPRLATPQESDDPPFDPRPQAVPPQSGAPEPTAEPGGHFIEPPTLSGNVDERLRQMRRAGAQAKRLKNPS